MSFPFNDVTRVNRNSTDQNELRKAIDEDIEKCLNVHEAMSLNEATSQVLNRAEYALSRKDYVNLLLGCGCCQRHAKGILPMGEEHVTSFDMSEPSTQTEEGKPCACRCRSMARFNIRSSHEQHEQNEQ